MAEAAIMIEPGEERLVVTRDLRVACGDDLEVRAVKCGEPWPADAPGRLDVLIRTGYVVRFAPDGSVDPRSAAYARRLGIVAPRDYPSRTWARRAAALAQTIVVHGISLRVFAGKPDTGNEDLYEHDRRAYGLLRGLPDGAPALEDLRHEGPGAATPRRRRATRKKAKAGAKKKATKGTKAKRRRRRPES